MIFSTGEKVSFLATTMLVIMKKLSVLSALACATVLSACGDGYEAVRVDAFPYGNDRTAGTGVAYVLKKMAPTMELNIEPVATPDIQPEPVEIPDSVAKPELAADAVLEEAAAELPAPDIETIDASFDKLFQKKQQKK